MFSSARSLIHGRSAARLAQLTPARTTSPSTSLTLSCKTYVSRAHPTPRPIFAISEAVEMVLERAEERRTKILTKWEKYNKNPYKLPEEAVELVLGLNLDPRKAGQSLRGSISLPHGSGKTLQCLVFTEDEALVESALEKGATHAGAEELVEKIVSGEISLDKFDRALATKGIMPVVTRKLARMLGPRGLMPNVKTGTLCETSSELMETLNTQIAGKEIVFRTEPHGGVLVSVGKVGFGKDKLLENIGEVVQHIHSVKPEVYGKGKIKKNAKKTKAKYMLRAYLSSTQGKGYKLDLTTIDPSSSFYLD